MVRIKHIMSSELNSLLVVINFRAGHIMSSELNSLLVVINFRAYNVVRIKLIACSNKF